MTRRALLWPVLMLAHLGAGAVLLQSGVVAAPVPEARAMAVVAVPAPAVAPPAPVAPVELAVATAVEAPVVEIATIAPAMSVAGADCALAARVAAAVQDSAAARAALDGLPAQARSVANAVMLWDGSWTAPAGAGGLAPLRAVVEASIRAAPADCRAAPVTGPRLLFVGDGAGTTVLAVGSGNWTWDALLS